MSDRPLRVAFDVAALGQGGMERQLVDLAAGLLGRGHEPVLVVNKSVSAYRDDIEAAGIPLHELGSARRADPSLVGRIAELLRRHHSQVVVGVNYNATVMARLAARRVGIPGVAAEHSIVARRGAATVVANRLLAGSTAAVIACAEAQRPYLVRLGNPGSRIVVVHNGVDVDRLVPDATAATALRAELGIASEAFVIAMVAAHRAEKRQDRFVEAIEALAARGVDCVGLMAGGGPLLEDTRRRAHASPAADRLLVVGPRDDLGAVYSAADVCVLVSEADTLPLALMEAQACACPVVAMDVGGTAEAFDPGRTGVLVPQGDVSALVEALAALSEEPELARAMGAAGRRWVVEQRSVSAMVDGYVDVLSDVVERAARR